jgi:hypothetical protein
MIRQLLEQMRNKNENKLYCSAAGLLLDTYSNDFLVRRTYLIILSTLLLRFCLQRQLWCQVYMCTLDSS